jgi:hypothetical protein
MYFYKQLTWTMVGMVDYQYGIPWLEPGFAPPKLREGAVTGELVTGKPVSA